MMRRPLSHIYSAQLIGSCEAWSVWGKSCQQYTSIGRADALRQLFVGQRANHQRPRIRYRGNKSSAAVQAARLDARRLKQ